MELLLNPHQDAIFYEDEKLYVCLASFPITNGHTVVVWKDKVEDLHLLEKQDYEYLMDKVDEVRNALMRVLEVQKIYLFYMDEAKQVHWHLVPRYNEEGFNILIHKPKEIKDFSLTIDLREIMRKSSPNIPPKAGRRPLLR